jgi:hypothetical protein
MVYNALKLFMEINAEKFNEVQAQYKAQRKAYVVSHTCLPVH